MSGDSQGLWDAMYRGRDPEAGWPTASVLGDHPKPLRTLIRPRRSLPFACMAAMGVAITVRDVPTEVRDELAARAGRAGKSMQEYLRGTLVDSAARPPVEKVIARARARVEATGVQVDAESILAARDADRR